MNILIAGDFFISDEFRNKDLIDQSVIDAFDNADYRMVNLEAPVTADNPNNNILKTGPHLRTSEETVIPFLKQLQIDAVTLANNHILDYGTKGLTDTFGVLKNNEIDYVGAGNNLAEANKPLTLEKDGMKIAILNFCENEWSIAEDDKPGANPMDIIDNTMQIKAAKATHDKVICIIHGGHIGYFLPSPQMQKLYRFYADNGADIIITHHAHRLSGYEIYNNTPILYGLGSFLFTRHKKNNDEWYRGLFVNITFSKNAAIGFELFFTKQEVNTFRVSLPSEDEKKNRENEIDHINKIIPNKQKLESHWEKWVNVKAHYYLNSLLFTSDIKNRFVKFLFNKINISNFIRSNNHNAKLLNIIRCEAHKELISKFLFLKKKRAND